MDESKPSILSEPLLPPSPPSTYDSSSSTEPISYVHSPRPLRDLPALLLFLLLSLSTFALGFLSIYNHNPHHSDPHSFDPLASSCNPNPNPNPSLSLPNPAAFKKDLIWTLVATAVVAGPAALALLRLLRHFARQVVYAAVPLFILLPSFLNVYWFVACALSSSCSKHFPLPYRILILVFVFLVIGVFVWIIVANWHRIELTVRIIRVAAAALGDNLGLVAVLPGLAVGTAVYFVPVVVFLVFATWNGRVMPREEEGGGHECIWKEDGWVPAYFALAIITMIWTTAAMVEAQVYVISGTIAQWYFDKEEGSKPRRSIRSSLRLVVGVHFFFLAEFLVYNYKP